MPGHGMNNFYPENTREIRRNPTRFQIVEIPNRRTSDRPFFDDLEALVYSFSTRLALKNERLQVAVS